MKALIRKDLYTTAASMRTIFLIMAVFAVVTIFAKDTGFYIPYLVVLPCTLASTLINIDAREKWDVCALTLPVSRRTVISARYIFVLLLILGGVLVGTVCFVLRVMRGFESGSLFQAVSMCLSTALLVPSVTIPMAYKFGADKGRYIVILLIMGLMLALMSVSGEGYTFSGALAWMSPWMLLAASSVLFVLSWALTTAIYEKKDIV